MEIISYEDALEKGLKFYFTGIYCKHGHLSPQYVSTRSCVECTKTRSDRRYNAKKDEILSKRKKWRISQPRRRWLRNIKYRARRKGIPYELTDEFLYNMDIPKYCPCCGVEMVLKADASMRGAWNMPSMDRIIGEYGYIEGNIIIICWKCNKAKSAYDIEWFKFWYDLMLKTQEKLK